MKTVKNRLVAVTMMLMLLALIGLVSPQATAAQNLDGQKIEKIRKELATLPYYGIFDNLAYRVEGDTVTLYGQVLRPTTRSDAERRVAKIAGVQRVVNEIEVLPVSSFDDRIRERTYRRIFRTGGLYRYALGANPSLHIIVKNGHVALEGMVANEADKQLAYVVANGVPGVFSVTNNLRTERDEAKLY